MVKNLVLVLGVVLALVGILGFFNDPVLGIFEVDAVHNIVHLASGILAIVFAMQSDAAAATFAKVFGVVYLLVAVLGFVATDFLHSVMEVNGADHFLHVLLAVVFLAVSFMHKGDNMNTPAAM